jgi:hypothetical protein
VWFDPTFCCDDCRTPLSLALVLRRTIPFRRFQCDDAASVSISACRGLLAASDAVFDACVVGQTAHAREPRPMARNSARFWPALINAWASEPVSFGGTNRAVNPDSTTSQIPPVAVPMTATACDKASMWPSECWDWELADESYTKSWCSVLLVLVGKGIIISKRQPDGSRERGLTLQPWRFTLTQLPRISAVPPGANHYSLTTNPVKDPHDRLVFREHT